MAMGMMGRAAKVYRAPRRAASWGRRQAGRPIRAGGRALRASNTVVGSAMRVDAGRVGNVAFGAGGSRRRGYTIGAGMAAGGFAVANSVVSPRPPSSGRTGRV